MFLAALLPVIHTGNASLIIGLEGGRVHCFYSVMSTTLIGRIVARPILKPYFSFRQVTPITADMPLCLVPSFISNSSSVKAISWKPVNAFSSMGLV